MLYTYGYNDIAAEVEAGILDDIRFFRKIYARAFGRRHARIARVPSCDRIWRHGHAECSSIACICNNSPHM